MQPVVKWVGGKTRLLPELVKRAPKKFNRLVEPFAGGAALYFHLAPERALLADSNGDLIATYAAIASDPEAVIRRLMDHRRVHAAAPDAHYYRTRARWNAGNRSAWSRARHAATFIYLNKTCFNGLWRVNRDGEFNVPIGRYSNPSICMPKVIRAASKALSSAKLLCSDYRKAIASVCSYDFIYLDPPYDPLSATSSFTGYSANAFGRDQQKELAETARELVARDAYVMLSNSDTPFIRSLYRGFKISRVKCGRSISSKITKRAAVNELIITGGPS